MKIIKSIVGLFLIEIICVNSVFAQLFLDNSIGLENREIVLPDNMDTANCEFFPDGVEWGVRVGWSSDRIASNFNVPLVGDLDDDGNPEIICCSQTGDMLVVPYRYNDEILVFDGVTKQLKTRISLVSKITASDVAAYGLVKLPNRKGLIVVASFDYKLRAYDINSSNPSNPYWVSDVDFGSNFGDWAVNVNFADFNSDGHPEVYVRNKIYNAETGVMLAQAIGTNTASSYAHWSHLVHYKVSSPIAADVCGDDNLELILGNKVFSVNLVNLNGQSSNSITLVKSITPPSGILEDGHPQVADFNLDGYLDVFISIRNTDVLSGAVYGYVWDVHNNTVSLPFVINTSFSGKSIPMIDDIDNDGLMEVLIQCGVSGSNEKFHTYKYHPDTKTFSFLWGYVTDEDSFSNGITSFDFNQDGLLELIICDQSTLRIVNGSGISHITHQDTIPVYVISSFPFSEITIMQYPVVADADDDGHAEIVSVGGDKLNILESSGAEWAPARKVWNQYMYNVTHVNNDLTVMQYQFNNGTAFTDPTGMVRLPFNNFLQQVTTLDQYGRPYIPAADATVVSTNITTGSGNAMLDVIYTNQGDYKLKAPYGITIFVNQLGGEVLQTIMVNNPLPVGETVQQNIALSIPDLCSLQDVSTLVVAINCAGGGIAQNGGLQSECDLTNNTASVSINLQNEPTYISETACDQFEWNGNNYTQSGEYEATLTNSFGCDSIVNLNLTINHSDTMSFNVSSCESYLWNEQTYTSSGIYTYITTNEFGCNRTEILDLDITSSSLSIQGKTSIYPSTDITSGIYQYHIDSIGINTANVHWSIDREDWLLFPKGASCDLVCTSEGQAILRAWTEGELCDVDTTMVLNASFYTIGENEMQSATVYPNPTNGSVTISWQGIVAIKVFNLLGQIIDEHEFEKQDKVELDMQDYQKAVYILEISTSDRKVYKSVVLSK